MAIGTTASKAPAAKYDSQIATQLARAEARVRLLDLTAGSLGLVALTLLFAVVMVICDSKLGLSASIRQASLTVFLLGGSLYAWFAIVQPLRRRINPYYAALKVEALIPGAKNSIVNWVDLHGDKLPPAIRAAVGQKAAKDLTRADVDKAVSGKRAGWAGGIATGALVVFVIALLVLGRSPFFSLLGRTFAPFGGGSIATRNSIDILQPAGGDATLPIGRPFMVVADVRGPLPGANSPDAPRLQYRYDANDPWIDRFLQLDEGRGWTATLNPNDVRNGFSYRVAAGDAVTPEYQVRYRANATITDFLATYQFRPYVARIDELRHDRELKALRGTSVLLRVRTNRTLQSARLEWEGRDEPIPATILSDDPGVFEVRLVLKDDGKYRLAFTPIDEVPFTEPQWFPVTAIPDQPPKVELTRPGVDVKLPANGLLELEGLATDDIGVKSVTLRSRIVTGATLKAKPYRAEEGLKLEGGGYPVAVGYKDFVDLSKVQTEPGQPVELRAGMELEYWLEAADACDFDRPNVSSSKHYRVQIIEPEKDAERGKKERERAEREQKQHDQDQDRKQKEEASAREKDRQQQEAANAAEKEKSEKAKKEAQPREGDDNQKDGKGKKNDGTRPPEQEPDKGPKPDDQNPLNPQDQKTADSLKGAVDRKKDAENQQEDGKGGGEAKGDPSEKPGQGKDGGSSSEKNDGDQQPGRDRQQDAEAKKGANAEGAKAGEGKDGGKSDPAEKNGEGKQQGNSDPMNGREGEAKRGEQRSDAGKQPTGENKPHDSKEGGRESDAKGKKADHAQGEKAGEGKGGAKPDSGEKQGEGKPQGKPDPTAKGQQGEGKEGDERADGGAPGKAVDKPHDSKSSGSNTQAGAKPQPHGENKGGGSPEGQKDAAQAKPERTPMGGPKEARAQAKGQPSAEQRDQTAQKKGEPGSSAQSDGKDGGKNPSERGTAGSAKDAKGQGPGGGGEAAAEGKTSGKADSLDQKCAEGKPKPGKGGADGKPEDTTPEDVARLAQHLRNGDDRTRGDAQKRLEQVKDRAKDPQAREDATEALKKDGDGAANAAAGKAGPGKGPEAPPKGSDPTAEGKHGKGESADSGTTKKDGGPPAARQGEGKDGKDGDASDGKGRNSSGMAKGPGKRGGSGNDPGNGAPGDRSTAGNGSPSEPPLPGKGDKPGTHRPSMLQLEEFKKLVDSKVLKDAKLTEEEYQRFLKAYEEAASHQKDVKRPDKPIEPMPGVRLPSIKGSSTDPVNRSPDDLRGDGRALPPPAYRDAYREFTREFSRPPEKK
jgi:hypothetical protein